MITRTITKGTPGCAGYREATARLPEASDVDAVKLGGTAPDAFGNMSLGTRIAARDHVRANGNPFVHYVTAMHPTQDTVANGCGCSNGMVAGVLMRDVKLTGLLTSAECDDLEESMRAEALARPAMTAAEHNAFPKGRW